MSQERSDEGLKKGGCGLQREKEKSFYLGDRITRSDNLIDGD